MVKAFLLGTHQYQKYFFPFAYLFKKYWGDDIITWVGDKPIDNLPDNVEFMQVPAYSEGVWPWEHFGTGLLSLLNIIDDKIIVIFFPDQWINKEVDMQGVETLKEFMLKYPFIIRANLTAGTLYDAYGQEIDSLNGYSVTTIFSDNIRAGLEGGITFCPSLWNVELLKQIIQHDWDLWACEKAGSDKMRFDRVDLMTIGTNPAVLHRTHGLYHNEPNRISFDGLNYNDMKMVRDYIL